jgi:hypothetical protein
VSRGPPPRGELWTSHADAGTAVPLAAARPSGKNRPAISIPARKEAHEDPPIDPLAVERAFALARAKRRARIEHQIELKRARIRFLALLLGLIFVALFLALSIWEKIEALFGL